MEAAVAKPKSQKDSSAGVVFNPGAWTTSIDVRDFIASNATPYLGDEKSLASDSGPYGWRARHTRVYGAQEAVVVLATCP